MIRKTLLACLAVAAMMATTLAFNTTSADAIDGEPTCPYYFVASNSNGNFVWSDDADVEGYPPSDFVRAEESLTCNEAIAYTGPFTNHPAAPTGPYGWGTLNVQAGAAPAPAEHTGGTGGGLAHTGSESTAIAFIGSGLIAFGAVALGSRRKFF